MQDFVHQQYIRASEELREGSGRGLAGCRVSALRFGLWIWEFPKIGDPNVVPKIVGSLL